MITIFTPAYNRSNTLPRLYESLKTQTYGNFEWLIVDDGSRDGTKGIVEKWINESVFPIRYYYQENGGKHRAINKGVKEAKGEWFFIVDSDDYLLDDSLEIIEKWTSEIEKDVNFAGVCGLKVDSKGNVMGPGFLMDCMDENPYKIDYRGDLAEVWKTPVLLDYPFPDYVGEKYCAECLVWFRIGQKYKIRYYNRAIYIADYLEGGLTRNTFFHRKSSPNYTLLTNRETMQYACPWKRRLRAAINYWRFIFYKKFSINDFVKLPWFAYFMIPIGVLASLRDRMLKPKD